MGKVEQMKEQVDHKFQEMQKDYLSNRNKFGEEQKNEIAEAKKKYYAQESMQDAFTLSRVEKELGTLGVKIYNSHLPYVSEIYSPLQTVSKCFNEHNRIAYFDITRWVNDTEEKNIDKLINVYQVLAGEECNIALIYDRKKDSCTVTMAVVSTTSTSMPKNARENKERVIKAIYGNFPGAEIKTGDSYTGIPSCLQNVVSFVEEKDEKGKIKIKINEAESVAIITNLATDKSENFISQSMEKLLDGIVPDKKEEEYKLILLASPSGDVGAQKSTLYDIYNCLAPYATWQESFSTTDNTAIGAGSSLATNMGMNAGVKAGVELGVNFGVNFGKTANYNVSVGKNEGETKTCTNYAVKHSLELLEGQIKRLEQCSALGMWEFAAYAVSKDKDIVKSVASMYLALTQGEDSYLSQSAINFWYGDSKTEEAAIILEQLKRIHHPHFVLKKEVCEDNSDILLFPQETDLCTLISGKELVRALNFPRKSVAGFPVIECAAFGRETQRFAVSGNDANSGKSEDATEDMLDVGNIVHMYRKEEQRVKLDINSFTSHTFVTGSTGTGKSNTIYQILSGFQKKGKKALVIEPAKGEYKTALDENWVTYGTNPKISDLLRINPFSFPTGKDAKKPIHVLEHIDRLTEIFNACWPMYAAMPAVLKEAIEKAYVNKGWDLYSSDCYPLIFPTFADLLETLPQVIENSQYSKDTKNDYEGALITRVRSLTNGINGLVLCANNELTNEELFERNVIVDISRVGSGETKALLMGILIMKLQEYHMSSAKMNENLQHVTVLEEAHNLLRRSTASQGQEGANLQGKSVEMLTNSIAEMRTYGEGFIIADQAPGLLDEAVIRNTNTKIILRLPDASDRELVGKAAGLKDAQIDELAKLPKGVAVVYQNDWVDAVLCQFEKYENAKNDENVEDCEKETSRGSDKGNIFERFWEYVFEISEELDLTSEQVDQLKKWIDVQRYPNREILWKCLDGEVLDSREKEIIAYNLFAGCSVGTIIQSEMPEKEQHKFIENAIAKMYEMQDEQNQIADEVEWFIRMAIQHESDMDNLRLQNEKMQEMNQEGDTIR